MPGVHFQSVVILGYVRVRGVSIPCPWRQRVYTCVNIKCQRWRITTGHWQNSGENCMNWHTVRSFEIEVWLLSDVFEFHDNNHRLDKTTNGCYAVGAPVSPSNQYSLYSDSRRKTHVMLPIHHLWHSQVLARHLYVQTKEVVNNKLWRLVNSLSKTFKENMFSEGLMTSD